jgi:spore germination protein YaaH
MVLNNSFTSNRVIEMPYKLEKSGKGYYVVSKDSGMKHSLKPLPLETAQAQMRALYRALRMRGEFAR